MELFQKPLKLGVAYDCTNSIDTKYEQECHILTNVSCSIVHHSQKLLFIGDTRLTSVHERQQVHETEYRHDPVQRHRLRKQAL